MANLFSYVKDAVKISDFVQTVPTFKGITKSGIDKYRCNNILAGGSNLTAMLIDDQSNTFKVYSHDQLFGDVIELYRLTIGGGPTSSPYDAAVGLARHMSIPIPQEMLESRGKSATAKMMNGMDNLCNKLHDYLMESEEEDAVTARKYLFSRGASKDMISDWKLGLFPENMSDSRSIVDSSGDNDVFVRTGILKKTKNGRSYVPMAGRLAFPIFNPQDRCVSFSSRVIPGLDSTNSDSKYINTTSTDIYDKSSILYGSHLLKGKLSQIIICEGNFDVIALNETTPDDVVAVATCGTSLTTGHINLITRYHPRELMVYFDTDDAGKKAASNSIWVMNHINRTGIYSPQGENKDPWDVYSSGGDIEVEYHEPMTFTASRLITNIMDRDESVKWFQSVYPRLNYNEDQESLTSAMSRYLGVSTSFLKSKAGSTSKSNRRRSQGIEISPLVTSLILGLQEMEPHTRREVGYFLISRRYSEKVMDACGVTTDDERDCILAAMGSRKVDDKYINYVNHLPILYDSSTDPQVRDMRIVQASANVSMRVLKKWREEGTPPGMKVFTPALSMMSSMASTAPGAVQLGFALDAAAS